MACHYGTLSAIDNICDSLRTSHRRLLLQKCKFASKFISGQFSGLIFFKKNAQLLFSNKRLQIQKNNFQW